MKIKASAIILIVFFTVCFTAFFVYNAGVTQNTAFADSYYIGVQKITAVSNGAEVNIGEQVWGKNIKIYYECNAPYIKFSMTSKTGWTYTSDFIVPSSTYILDIPQEGIITVAARVYNNHQIEQQNLGVITQVYADNTIPQEPDIDLTALNTYHINDFQLRYRIYVDNFSGINFNASWLAFDSEDQDSVIERISLAQLIPVERRDLDNYLNIKNNGVLSIYIVDNAGNGKDYHYTYTKHGVPKTGKPTVILSTTDYAKSVSVQIVWGEGYDDNPFAEKKYAIVSPMGPIPYDYTEPIEITTEGEIQLLIYYYENGEKKYLTQTINNVDRTPPSLNLMQDSAYISCDVMADKPVVFFIKTLDRLSGIKRVFFKTGGELEIADNGYYCAPIMDMRSFTVVAEDYAGNRTEYIYHNNYFDFATLKENNLKFVALNRDDYTSDGWAEIEKACHALSMLLLNDKAQSSEIAVASRAIDSAIIGVINVTNIIGKMPIGLEGGITFNLSPADTDARKGEIIYIRYTNAANDNLASQAGDKSGIKKRKVYSFSINITGVNNSVNLTGNLLFNMPLPKDAIGAKLYADVDGELIQVTSEVKDGRVYATTSVIGDFYLIAERTGNDGIYIAGKLYSWKLISITAAIIVGVCIVGFIITYTILKKRRAY